MSSASDFVIKDGVLIKYVGSGGNVVIPEGVTSIGRSAFENCSSLTSVTIPESVTEIGWSAFENCSSLASVTSIGDSAFENCRSLTSVVIPERVTYIGGYAFKNCSNLTSVTIPASVTSIGYEAFSGCTGLKTAGPIGGGYDYEFGWTNEIPDHVFENCSGLRSVTIPSSVTEIGGESVQRLRWPCG